MQLKLLVDLIFEPVHFERRRSLPLSILVKPVDSIIRKRANSMQFHCLAGTQQSFLQGFSCLRSLYQQSIFNCQWCHVYMQGDRDVAYNMYPIPAVYQKYLTNWHKCCIDW